MLSAATTQPANKAHAPTPPACCSESFHEQLKASTRDWLQLAHQGFQTGFPETDLYELRTCKACDSTLARPVKILKLQYVSPRAAAVRAVAKPAHMAAAGVRR